MALLLAALDSQALTLGRLRGAALIGQGLDVSIQVQTDPDEASSSLCFEAEVFHADARQDPSRLQVSVEPTQTPQTVSVRIQSSVAVDEPIVTVYLKAGCIQKVSRRYVMLADVLTELAAPVATRLPQLPLVVPVATPAEVSPVQVAAGNKGPAARAGSPAAPGGASTVTRSKSTPKPPARSAVTGESHKPPPAKAVAPVAAAAAAAQTKEKLVAGRAAGQSRLKLDPLEVLSERVATLESSTATAPAEQAAREVRDAQRLQSLESSVKNLLALATRNETSLAELRVRLQQAESDRYANPLVYALAALLLACLAGFAFLLTRRGGSGSAGGNWWSGASNAQNTVRAGDVPANSRRGAGYSPMSSPAPLSTPGFLSGAEHDQQQTSRSGPSSKAAPITQVDVSLVEMSESTFDRLMQSGTTHSAVRKSRSEESAESTQGVEPRRRLINTDDLFDIRQQAEFFVSLGQTDQAVRILENRISESGESSPQAYLDLLKIFHSLGLKADFRQVREDFNLLFNARVPEFASFDNEGRDLDAYQEIVTNLMDVWGEPELLPLIEALLFREQWSSQRELLDLAAFRDLLLLHAVAGAAAALPDRLLPATGRGLPRSPFSNAGRPVVQTPASQTATLSGLPTELSPGQLELPPLVAAGEVDIDLSDLSFDLSSGPDTVPVPAQVVRADPGNLIDFDLPKLPQDGSGSSSGRS